jgi:predicted nuclease of predicted toxin-antitoxin system
MRILANENFPQAAVDALRQDGHDVLWVRAESPGISDRDVLSRARLDARVVVTSDKDFGELAFRYGLPAECGIILFRIAMTSPLRVAKIAVSVLAPRDDWAGHFAVVEDDRVRMTPLPIFSTQSLSSKGSDLEWLRAGRC